jgi:hypothetical protein
LIFYFKGKELTDTNISGGLAGGLLIRAIMRIIAEIAASTIRELSKGYLQFRYAGTTAN